MGYYSAIKRDEAAIQPATQMDLEKAVLSESG